MEASQLTAFKEARQAAGLSQQEVAQKARCSLSTVRLAENGVKPSDRMQRKLARVVGGKAEELWPS